MDGQQYCLKWNNFSQHLKYAFNTIWSSDDSFTDVTLAVQGGFKMRGHKMVLSACSYYFKKLLVADTSESPVLILHDVTRPELEALVHFMYHGEVNVTQDVIPGLLKAAEMLQIRGLCAAPAQGFKASGSSTPTGRAGKRAAADPPPPTPAAKKARKKPPPPPPLTAAPPEVRGRSSVESEDSRDTNGVGGGSDNEGDGQLRIDEESNGLEPETLLDEQDADGDGWSQGSGATDDQLYPLPRGDREAAPSPECFTFSSQLKNLAVKIKLEPRLPNDLEAAIVSSMPKNSKRRMRTESRVKKTTEQAGYGEARNRTGGHTLCVIPAEDEGAVRGGGGEPAALTDEQPYLAFHEPRPCPHCRRVYRDAATLRTHVAIMHSEDTARRGPFSTWTPPLYIPLVVPCPPAPLPLRAPRPGRHSDVTPASRQSGWSLSFTGGGLSLLSPAFSVRPRLIQPLPPPGGPQVSTPSAAHAAPCSAPSTTCTSTRRTATGRAPAAARPPLRPAAPAAST